MAGVTDLPFRRLCHQLGAGMVVTEMVAADPNVRDRPKTQLRMHHHDECQPKAVQIAGGNAAMLAEFAKVNEDLGADIIDINMGCPAKKVRKQAAGSALLDHEDLVADILHAVVRAVQIPVTLKIRTGPNPSQRNGLRIAQLAEQAGIRAIAVHGRTRACAFKGHAEYDTIRDIKAQVGIPVIANGDINTPEEALNVMQITGADAVMIGRGAQGKPWIFQACVHYAKTGELLPNPSVKQVGDWLLDHMEALYAFYGTHLGCRIAKKHVGWYAKAHPEEQSLRLRFNQLTEYTAQMQCLQDYFQA